MHPTTTTAVVLGRLLALVSALSRPIAIQYGPGGLFTQGGVGARTRAPCPQRASSG